MKRAGVQQSFSDISGKQRQVPKATAGNNSNFALGFFLARSTTRPLLPEILYALWCAKLIPASVCGT